MTRFFDNSVVRVIINDQQRINHALALRHWHTYHPTERQLKAAIAKVLRSNRSEVHITKGVRLGMETATVYTRQVMVAEQKQWLSVAIYETGSRVGKLATALEPTMAQLIRHGLR